MQYAAELRFFQRILEQLNLPFHIVAESIRILPQLDLGLPLSLSIVEKAASQWETFARHSLKEQMLLHLTDEFQCRYILLQLPETEGKEVLVIGPYTAENIDTGWILSFMNRKNLHGDWQAVLENFYHRVRYLEQEHMLVAALHALADHLWGPQQYTVERISQDAPQLWHAMNEKPDPQLRDDILNRIRTIEKRYEAENRLMELVRQGRGQKVQLMLSHFSRVALERRGDPTRDARNYTIILNTLMRKAVEQGGVPPLYIDRISTDFAKRIERISDWKSLMELWDEMARTYCHMVKKQNVTDLPPTIQKVISRIDFDLTADLSLRATAKALNMNASYLSTLFKRTTGETLTDYVSRKRMEHAAYLLTSTKLPISSVAINCGISDDNYFTKLFKRWKGTTPVQFRQENRIR